MSSRIVVMSFFTHKQLRILPHLLWIVFWNCCLRIVHSLAEVPDSSLISSSSSSSLSSSSSSSNDSLSTNISSKTSPECPPAIDLSIAVDTSWLEEVVIGNFRVWHIMFSALAVFTAVTVVLCCIFRCRIPRTKQEIEADFLRKKITKGFLTHLERIKLDELQTDFNQANLLPVFKKVEKFEEEKIQYGLISRKLNWKQKFMKFFGSTKYDTPIEMPKDSDKEKRASKDVQMSDAEMAKVEMSVEGVKTEMMALDMITDQINIFAMFGETKEDRKRRLKELKKAEKEAKKEAKAQAKLAKKGLISEVRPSISGQSVARLKSSAKLKELRADSLVKEAEARLGQPERPNEIEIKIDDSDEPEMDYKEISVPVPVEERPQKKSGFSSFRDTVNRLMSFRLPGKGTPEPAPIKKEALVINIELVKKDSDDERSPTVSPVPLLLPEIKYSGTDDVPDTVQSRSHSPKSEPESDKGDSHHLLKPPSKIGSKDSPGKKYSKERPAGRRETTGDSTKLLSSPSGSGIFQRRAKELAKKQKDERTMKDILGLMRKKKTVTPQPQPLPPPTPPVETAVMRQVHGDDSFDKRILQYRQEPIDERPVPFEQKPDDDLWHESSRGKGTSKMSKFKASIAKLTKKHRTHGDDDDDGGGGGGGGENRESRMALLVADATKQYREKATTLRTSSSSCDNETVVQIDDQLQQRLKSAKQMPDIGRDMQIEQQKQHKRQHRLGTVIDGHGAAMAPLPKVGLEVLREEEASTASDPATIVQLKAKRRKHIKFDDDHDDDDDDDGDGDGDVKHREGSIQQRLKSEKTVKVKRTKLTATEQADEKMMMMMKVLEKSQQSQKMDDKTMKDESNIGRRMHKESKEIHGDKKKALKKEKKEVTIDVDVVEKVDANKKKVKVKEDERIVKEKAKVKKDEKKVKVEEKKKAKEEKKSETKKKQEKMIIEKETESSKKKKEKEKKKKNEAKDSEKKKTKVEIIVTDEKKGKKASKIDEQPMIDSKRDSAQDSRQQLKFMVDDTVKVQRSKKDKDKDKDKAKDDLKKKSKDSSRSVKTTKDDASIPKLKADKTGVQQRDKTPLANVPEIVKSTEDVVVVILEGRPSEKSASLKRSKTTEICEQEEKKSKKQPILKKRHTEMVLKLPGTDDRKRKLKKEKSASAEIIEIPVERVVSPMFAIPTISSPRILRRTPSPIISVPLDTFQRRISGQEEGGQRVEMSYECSRDIIFQIPSPPPTTGSRQAIDPLTEALMSQQSTSGLRSKPAGDPKSVSKKKTSQD